ncbi:MAG: flagellar motor protein MotB [Actinomycetota bacterium]|nr:flagellar motor protein MotB [Actinomycetota bacterium]
MARQKKPEEPPKGAPGWMASYGDLMSLLLVFFILLYSFSVTNLEKFNKAIGSINLAVHGVAGVLRVEEGSSTAGSPGQGSESAPGVSGGLIVEGGEGFNTTGIPKSDVLAMQQIKREIEEKVKEAGHEKSIQTATTRKGVMVRLTDQVLFDLGRASLKPGVLPVLKSIAESFKDSNYGVMIEGHTCDLPIYTAEFYSNW